MTADQEFFLGRPRGRFGFCTCGSFFGRPRFFCSGFGTGIDKPRASSSSNTQLIVCTHEPSSDLGGSGASTIRHAELRS
ncbi:MAG: hypothetical protein IKD90_09035, partial [Clostridiales bacterium]|nr:hypothetical protein [Clostridiales bacterium]